MKVQAGVAEASFACEVVGLEIDRKQVKSKYNYYAFANCGSLFNLERNMEQLKQFKTCDLVREIESRKCVKTHVIEPCEMLALEIKGAAITLVVVD